MNCFKPETPLASSEMILASVRNFYMEEEVSILEAKAVLDRPEDEGTKLVSAFIFNIMFNYLIIY